MDCDGRARAGNRRDDISHGDWANWRRRAKRVFVDIGAGAVLFTDNERPTAAEALRARRSRAKADNASQIGKSTLAIERTADDYISRFRPRLNVDD